MRGSKITKSGNGSYRFRGDFPPGPDGKRKQKKITVTQPAAQEAKVIDLMSALEASLAAVKKKAPAGEGAKQARAR